jgi:inositol phosphorylceramide mannosyltransferase catalytic subunit
MVMIPNIIHQIWIGPNTRPDIWMDTVRKFCHEFGYQYKLWDNDAAARFPLENRATYNKVKEYCGKADILRYEILHKYGGVYIDADSVILKGDKLHKIISDFDDDCGFGYEIDNERICNGVILAKEGSQFLKHCIDNISSRDVLSYQPWVSIGPMYITELYNKYKDQLKVKTYARTIFYPRQWQGVDQIDLHQYTHIPEESVMFQYGYSTNFLNKLFPAKKPVFIFNRRFK